MIATRIPRRLVALPLIALGMLAAAAPAASPARTPAQRAHPAPASPAARDAADLAAFAHKAALLRDLGATQMVVTDGLPIATWQSDPDDPYPAWFVHHAALLTIFAPAEMRRFVDAAHVDRVQRVVAERCRILAKYGLKGVWRANEPAVLPEAFFAAHPDYRGPRIDQVTRSRKVYFAPDAANPDVLRLYRESITALLQACPEIDTFLWVTTDAGSGFDWAPSLYPGANGASAERDRPLADRVVGFMVNAQHAAAAAGHPVRIEINQIPPRPWMIPTFGPDVLANIVRQLPRGLAVNGKEGPDGRPFDTGMVAGGATNRFYPIVGLAVPDFRPVPASDGARRGYNLGDAESVDFNYRLFKATAGMPMGSVNQRLAALRHFAVGEVGEGQADTLISAWQALNDVDHYLDVLDFGGMLRFGHVLNRWIERPMVPFPLDLTDAEKAGWRPFLFQAGDEESAADLADIQAMRMYEGWGAHLLFQRAIELSVPRAESAMRAMQQIAAAAADPAARDYWNLSAERVQALIYLLRSADDMVGYQAQLDRVKALGIKPEAHPVLGTQSDWARTDMIDLARREIDTTVALRGLLARAKGPLLDLAPTADQETIMRLGPDLPDLLDRKVRTMNAHWRDYDLLFTKPNP
ncbi:MAG TPA: hypothetical protein VFT56_10345 [Sphingomonas sp.]|nr:hypothetical protein [Sphingomonas sp.]